MQTVYPILENVLIINQDLYPAILTARKVNPIMQIIGKQNNLSLNNLKDYTKVKEIFIKSIKYN